MEERNKAIAGCIIFAALILILGVGGYIYAFKIGKHNTKEIIQTQEIVDNKINSDKEYVYFENERVVSDTLNIVYRDVVVNLDNASAKEFNDNIVSENTELYKGIKKISDQQIEEGKEVAYDTDDIYSAILRDYATYTYKDYISVVISDKEYNCFDGLSKKEDIKAYVFDKEKNQKISNVALLMEYNTSVDKVKEEIKNKLDEKQTEDEEGNKVLKIDETLKSITDGDYAVYVDNNGSLIIKYIVKSNDIDYNDSIEIKGE